MNAKKQIQFNSFCSQFDTLNRKEKISEKMLLMKRKRDPG